MEQYSSISSDVLQAVRTRTAEEVNKAIRGLKERSDLESD